MFMSIMKIKKNPTIYIEISKQNINQDQLFLSKEIIKSIRFTGQKKWIINNSRRKFIQS